MTWLVAAASSGAAEGGASRGATTATSINAASSPTRPAPSPSSLHHSAAAAATLKAERLWAGIPYEEWAADSNTAALKRYLRIGVPPSFRCDVWYHVSGGAALAAAAAVAEGSVAADGTPLVSSGTYPTLVREGYAALARSRAGGGNHAGSSGGGGGSAGGASTSSLAAVAEEEGDAASVLSSSNKPPASLRHNSLRFAISGDAWLALREEASLRALPKPIADRLGALPGGGAATLQRLLVAYAAFNPAPGCLWKGVGLVAAFLLVVMRDEAKAFWTLAGVTNRLFGGYYAGKVRVCGVGGGCGWRRWGC